MGRSWWFKLVFLLAVTVLAGLYVYPTARNLDPAQSNFPIKQKVNLGLDLQGGLYLVMGVDFQQVYQEVVDRQGESFLARLKEKKLGGKEVKFVRDGADADDPRVVVRFDGKNRDAAYELLKDEFYILRLTSEAKGSFELGLAHKYRRETREKTINQSIEVIRNRIDEFGVAEPSITSQGTDRLVVELPGVREVERAKALIGRTAKLEFKIVDDQTLSPAELVSLIAEIEKKNGFAYKEGEKFSDYVRKLNKAARKSKKITDKNQIAFERVKGATGKVTQRVPYLLFSKAEVTGEDLQDASVAFDPETRQPNVSFEMNPRGANLFGELTKNNIRKRLAIVLDGIVHSAPVIQSRINGRGQITLGQGNQNELLREAKDLSIVLRAGALPAQLELLEQRVVGPSLGQDSIQKGALASVLGTLAVFIFIFIYYRVSGAIAVVSLILNVLFVVAILVGLEATLTLPGIAGIALTVGIAVDSNVVIYERIREELRAGKRVGGAVESGFQKAFRTILDANITNAAAALVLLNFGTGPIKGFAVTLLIGIVCTLFTAVFVCRLFFDFYLRSLENRRSNSLSI